MICHIVSDVLFFNRVDNIRDDISGLIYDCSFID